MNAEFNWWLLIVGLVIGAALVWLIMADSVRRHEDIDATERAGEANWISGLLADAGRPIAPDRVEEILRIHGEYLAAAPPDEPAEPAPETDPNVTSAAADGARDEPTAEPSRFQVR